MVHLQEGASEVAWASVRDAQAADAKAVAALTEEYRRMVDGMRETFSSGRTKDLSWRRQQLRQIHTMIAEEHEEITAAIRKDLGGTKFRGVAEMTAAVDAEHALKRIGRWAKQQWVSGLLNRQYVRPEPKGVVLIIAPWNFPFNMCLQPLVPAIAAGNVVVIKPSEMNPESGPLIQRLVEEYLDTDCIKVVTGGVPETTALLNQRWDHIFYTGNGAIGRVVMAAAAKHLTTVTLELGGKSPVFVDSTAQMDATCSRIGLAKWLNCGQICVAPDFALVHESKLEDFVQRSRELVEKCYGADPKASPDWGRIVNERHVDRLRRLIETSGGIVACGGADNIDRAQRYVPPTIIVSPSLDSPLMQEEVFGPILAVLPFKDLDDALAIVSQMETPLAMYVFSQRNRNIEKILSTVTSGGVCVNSALEHILTNEIPFGGKGASGMGSYHGKFGFDEFSHRRAVLVKTTLPLLRGPMFPLPVAGKPLPDFVYNLAVKFGVIGIMPKCLKRLLCRL